MTHGWTSADDPRLARRVLEALAGGAADPPSPAVASGTLLDQLGAAMARAREAWPMVSLDGDLWCRYLAARLPPAPELERVLPSLHLDDLYLCCACAAGDAPALALFEERLRPAAGGVLRRLRLGQALHDEVLQKLTIRLLVAEQETPPVITRYSGIGTLSSWLRVVTSRMALKELAREKHLVASDDQRLAEELIQHSSGADLLHAKPLYLEAFREAFRGAMQSLGPREMNLLRQRFVDDLGLEEIGRIYRVHHTTVHRWLEKTRALLLQRTYEALAERLQIPRQECSTIIRMLQSDMDFTLHSFLGRKSLD
jgi:RNA polymerase sigma-70 factor, ECF subfamily